MLQSREEVNYILTVYRKANFPDKIQIDESW